MGGKRVGGGGLGRGLEADAEDAHEVPLAVADLDEVGRAYVGVEEMCGQSGKPAIPRADGCGTRDEEELWELGLPLFFVSCEFAFGFVTNDEVGDG